MSIQDSHAFVLEQSRANIEFIKLNPAHVSQGKQINAALANIVACERNDIMRKALERAIRRDHADLPGLPQS